MAASVCSSALFSAKNNTTIAALRANVVCAECSHERPNDTSTDHWSLTRSASTL